MAGSRGVVRKGGFFSGHLRNSRFSLNSLGVQKKTPPGGFFSGHLKKLNDLPGGFFSGTPFICYLRPQYLPQLEPVPRRPPPNLAYAGESGRASEGGGFALPQLLTHSWEKTSEGRAGEWGISLTRRSPHPLLNRIPKDFRGGRKSLGPRKIGTWPRAAGCVRYVAVR